MPATLDAFNDALHCKPADKYKAIKWTATATFSVDTPYIGEGTGQLTKDQSTLSIGEFRSLKLPPASAINSKTGGFKFNRNRVAEERQERVDGKIGVTFQVIMQPYTPSSFQIGMVFGFKSPQHGAYQDSKIIVIFDAANLEREARVSLIEKDKLAELAIMFPNITNLTEHYDKAVADERPLHLIELKHNGKARAVGLHAEHDFGEVLSGRFDKLSAIMLKPGTVTVLCQLKNGDIVDETNTFIGRDKNRHPLFNHFLTPLQGSLAHSFQHGQLLRPRHERPHLDNEVGEMPPFHRVVPQGCEPISKPISNPNSEQSPVDDQHSYGERWMTHHKARMAKLDARAAADADAGWRNGGDGWGNTRKDSAKGL